MAESSLVVPHEVTFEQAITITQSLLAEMEQNNLSPLEIEAMITSLVTSENGARGFFVTYLTDERTIADHPSEATVAALRSSPALVSPLLAKNLAMSTAMAVAHRRNQNEQMAQGSDRVQRRTLQLVQQMQQPEVFEQIQLLFQSAIHQTGAYQTFLERWGYDAEQQQQIAATAQQAIALKPV
jgi:hypothetical protein